MERFPEKRVVITGAGLGLGRAMALEFARHGWKVAVSDINEETAAETLELVKKSGGDGFVARCDATRLEDIENLAQAVLDRWGGVDVVINNAGILSMGFMEEIPPDDWRLILDLNVLGVVYGCRTFLPIMKKQGKGHIVNIGSAASFAAGPEMSSYNVSKAAVKALSETLRIELSGSEIDVSLIMPHWFRTNLINVMKTPSERQKAIAKGETDKIKKTADDVARDIYRAVEQRRFYVMSMWITKLLWLTKRLSPELYLRLGGFIYRKGWLYSS